MRQRSLKQERAARAERLRAEGWTWEEIAAEFRKHEPSSALLSLRWAHGRSQEDIARDYNGLLKPGEKQITFHTISDWEQWPDGGRPPPLTALNHLARIYQTTAANLFDGEDHRDLDTANQPRPVTGEVQELLDAAGSDGLSPITVLPAAASAFAGLPTDHVLHLELPDHTGFDASDATVIVLLCGRTPMDRRVYMKTNLVLPSIVVLGGPITGILDPDAQSTLANAWISAGKVGPEVLGPLGALLAGCRRMDDVIGARHLIEPAAGFIRMAAQLIPSATPEARKPLLSLAGEAAQFGGYLAMEVGNHGQARQYHEQGLQWAAAADDRTLAAYLWSRQGLEALWAGDLPRALSATDAARAQATDAPATVRALVEKTAGKCHAVAGQRSEVDRAFDEAIGLLDGGDRSGEPDWIYWVSAEDVTAGRGSAYADLGRGADALKVFSTALDALPSTFVRDRGHFLSHQANAYRLIGAIDDACEIGIQVLELARQTGSARMVGKVRSIHTALTDAQRQTPEARLLHDVLQEAQPAR